MTATYDDYRRALARLRDLSTRTSADLAQAKRTYSQKVALADGAVASADVAVANTLTAIEANLAAARAALEPLGKTNLVPPHIRPSGGITTANRDDVAKAQQDLTAAIISLRQAVQSEIRLIEAENERLAREALEQERLAREAAARAVATAARRKNLLRLGLAGGFILAVLVVILIVTL